MLQDDYRVRIEHFQGPLDLLLFLIRRAEVDISDIPVAKITDQYLAFLGTIDDIDVDLAGEFLVMAASLIELKSRTLMPPEPESADGEAAEDAAENAAGVSKSDPRFELVQQLLAYQRFRTAAEILDEGRHAFADRYARRPGRRPIDQDEEDTVTIELEDAHVMDLADAYERIMESIDFARLGDHVVEIDDTPIALHQEDLLDRLRHRPDGRLALQDAFEGQNRGARIGLFLALLELVRTRFVSVVQDCLEGPIQIDLSPDHEERFATLPTVEAALVSAENEAEVV